MKRCPTCGQVIAPDMTLRGPVIQRIYNELKRCPQTVDTLRQLIWGDREVGAHNLYVHVHILKRQLRPHGLTVRCIWGTYHLESLC